MIVFYLHYVCIYTHIIYIYTYVHYITLHYITLHYIYITLHYITLHYIYITLHYITCILPIYIYVYIYIGNMCSVKCTFEHLRPSLGPNFHQEETPLRARNLAGMHHGIVQHQRGGRTKGMFQLRYQGVSWDILYTWV